MEYTVQRLAELAGVSGRTLRYYDEIGLLRPAKINTSGYRIYGQAEVDRLQQIMFYRELGFALDTIKDILNEPSFDEVTALIGHRQKLRAKKERLDLLIANIDKTIASKERRIKMSDKKKFEGFKKRMIDENERRYGKEIREKYDAETIEKSKQKIINMTPAEHEDITKLSEKLTETLAKAFKTGDPSSDIAQKAADLHRQWLTFYWGWYDKKAHAGLAQSYVDDERFREFYDKEQPGTAAFLRDAIRIYTGIRE